MNYSWYMSMKRTNVYADPEDLAIIKEAAKRRGISEAEIILQGIDLAAMANRVWDEPLSTCRTHLRRGVRTSGPLGAYGCVARMPPTHTDADCSWSTPSATPGAPGPVASAGRCCR